MIVRNHDLPFSQWMFSRSTLSRFFCLFVFAALMPPALGQDSTEESVGVATDDSAAVAVEDESVTARASIDQQLQNAIETLLKQHRGDVSLAIRNLDSGERYEFNADIPMPTASLIKLPILVTTYQKAERGELDLSELVELTEDDKVPGSGVLTEHFSSSVSLPLRDYLRLMIRYSDNTATNIVADRIGLRSTAETMEALGLENTKLHSKVYRGSTTVFPDRSQQFGIGSTTAREMVQLLTLFHEGKLGNKESTEAMRQHLLSCEDDTKLAAQLPANVSFAHKTGAIANCRTDAGILYTSSGPVAVCFLSNKNEDQSWTDENEANVLASKIGAAIVQRFGSQEPDGRLREGAFGKLVEALQRTLNDRLEPSPKLSIDGDYGPATRSAVERFQRVHTLPESGVVDGNTWDALGSLIEKDDPVPAPDVVNSEKLDVVPQSGESDPPVVTCKAWAMLDQATGKLAFSSNADTPLEAASTTKIMTAYVVIKHADEFPSVLDERVRFSRRADNTVGSTAAIRVGESVTVREALYGLLLPSGNDASVALAEHFGARLSGDSPLKSGNTESQDALAAYDGFVSAMNLAAEQLGMSNTRYMNTHGLSHNEHVISAKDLARLSWAAVKYDLFRKISSTRQFGCVAESEQGYKRNVLWKNTNALLSIEGYDGIKTGTTSAAGACLVSSAGRNGDQLITVVLGSSSSPSRYADTRNLLRWAWQRRANDQ